MKIRTALFIDDIRNPDEYLRYEAGLVLWASDYDSAIKILEQGAPDLVSFDHDLGEVKSGYDIAKYIVENQIPIKYFTIHSANPVGRFNISQLLTHYGYQELT